MQLLKFLSLERFEAYRQTSQETESMLLARYLWNIALCEACYPLLSLFEVALRNAIDHTLLPVYGEVWLSENSSILKSLEKNEILKHKNKLGVEKASNRNQLIGFLTLGFWTGLFRKEYAPLWHAQLKAIFPHMLAKQRTPQHIQFRLSQVRYFRNRVFHHEPIWHWPNLLEKHEEIIEALNWLSPLLNEPLKRLDRFIDIYEKGTEKYLY